MRPQISYRYLPDEEAEAEFERRNRVLNHFSIINNRKQTNDAFMEIDNSEEANETPKKDLLLTELDYWNAYDSSSEEDGCTDGDANESVGFGNAEEVRAKRRLADEKKRSANIVAHKRRSTKLSAL